MFMQHTRTTDINGTSLKGAVAASFDKLVEVFGQPCLLDPPSSIEKVTTEWRIKFKDGTVATIYDWKNYGYVPPRDEKVAWHVGGFSSEALTHVKNALIANDSK
jgi:hypothetical protein